MAKQGLRPPVKHSVFSKVLKSQILWSAFQESQIRHRSPMYLYHAGPTVDYPNFISNPANPRLPYNLEVDADFLINDTVTTGWSASSLYLLANGIISLLWGIALVIFSLGIVPVDWVISQYGKNHSEIINTLITLIAAASTTHVKYTFQGILDHYSYYMLMDGFTLRQLAWMQGIKEWSLFTVTAFGSQRKRVAWMVAWHCTARLLFRFYSLVCDIILSSTSPKGCSGGAEKY